MLFIQQLCRLFYRVQHVSIPYSNVCASERHRFEVAHTMNNPTPLSLSNVCRIDRSISIASAQLIDNTTHPTE